MKANAVIDLEPYAIKGPWPSAPEPGRHLPRLHREQPLPRVQQQAALLPFTKSLAVRYFNEDLFKAGGVQKYGQTGGMMTFDDFKGLAAVSKKDASGKPTVYRENIRNDASYIDAFIYSNGGALLNNDNTKVRFNEPAGVEVYDMWGQLVQAGSAYVAQGRDTSRTSGARRSAPARLQHRAPLHQGLHRGQGHRAGAVQVGDRDDPPEGHGQAPDGHVRGQHHRLPHHPHQAGRLLGVDQVLHGARPDGAVRHQVQLHAHPQVGGRERGHEGALGEGAPGQAGLRPDPLRPPRAGHPGLAGHPHPAAERPHRRRHRQVHRQGGPGRRPRARPTA